MKAHDCESLYRDGRHYDALNSIITADIPFYVAEAKAASGPVLEIACGTGRLTIPIARGGVDITGLDISPSMLEHARKKALESGVGIDWVQADCRRFDLGRRFALIFIPFNSMLHLHDRESLEAFFGCVRNHLLPGGRFIVDVFNPSIAILARDPRSRREAYRYADPDGDGEVVIEEQNAYDDAAQINRVEWRYFIGGREVKTEILNMHCYFPKELDALLHYNGFEIMAKYGDFDRTLFGPGAPKQICVCETADRAG